MANNDALIHTIHAILDMVTGYDLKAADAVNARAAQGALSALEDAGAIEATVDGETGALLALEVTPLLTAMGAVVVTLVDNLAEAKGRDALTVIHMLREHFDRIYGAA